MTRYFMTIPEAVQLVLQSSLVPEACGNIAMLEMGEPVKSSSMPLTSAQRLRSSDPNLDSRATSSKCHVGLPGD